MPNSPITRDAILGPLTPRRGNSLTRWIGRNLLRLFGWRIVGAPINAPRFVVTAAPHTSNMDGALFLWASLALGFNSRFIAKRSLFRGPLGWLLTWLGGVAIDRNNPGGIVGSAVEQFEENSELVLVIAPEGTRKANAKWKTGFHRIALAAGVPICLGYMDYSNKTLGFGPSITPGPDVNEDLATMVAFYKTITPRFPERFVLPDHIDADQD